MKTIIAGSRDCTNMEILNRAVRREIPWEISEVVSGCARGADTLGETWAENHDILISKFPADWNTHGKRAGYLRNVQMAEHADALLALWDGVSRGTKHMIDIATAKGLLTYVYTYSMAENVSR